ncbi:MAG: hypothetical protein ABR974_14320 [Bacteroidales bacterium]|jgi:hypothetical protein
MNLQDKYPYDATILGLNGIFSTVGENSFLINSPCIVAEEQIITRGQNYILCGTPDGNDIEFNEIKLLDVYYYDNAINLIVQDLLSGIKYTVTQCLECDEVPCHWMLVDISYLLKQVKGSGNDSR